MKFNNKILAAGAALLLLASCGGKGEGESRSIADYGEISTADSLLYYFGQLRAADYWQFAKGDSTLAERASRDEYLKGLRAGLDAARDNDAYNQGLYVGVQLAMNMKDFSEEYGVELNRKIVYGAIEDGLANDSAVDTREANVNFRRLLEALNIQKEESDRQTAIATLSEVAKAGKWTKINDTLYGGLVKTAGQGAVVKEGEFVGISVEISDTDGKQIDTRSADRVRVGQGFPAPVSEAVATMKVGESRTFYTTAPAMFGRMMARYNLKPTQVLTFNVTVSAPAPAKESETAE